MKVALISDIHSNLFALKATLKDIKQRKVEKTYCLGDIIGYHSFPNEVTQLLQKEKVAIIKGNHDKDITEKLFSDKESDFIKRWTYEQLTEENIKYIKELPEELELELKGHRIALYHGSPESLTEYLHEHSENAQRAMDAFEGDILVCAHTHLPYIKEYENKTIINTGSVGKPKIGRPNASYIILELLTNHINTSIIEVEYDYESAAIDLEEKKLPQKFADALRSGVA